MATNTTIDQKSSQRHKPPDSGSLGGVGRLANIVIGYSNQVDEITVNLNAKEEELQKRPKEAELQNSSFNQLLDEYSRHEKYMTELCEYCHIIMRAKEDGQEHRDNETLSEEERDEVGLQMDALLVYYDRLKILATDRLRTLQRIIDEKQRSKIELLEKWLTNMESRLSSSNDIGPDYSAIQRQLECVNELRQELEQKQEFLNFISKVIIFDDFDSDSMQLRCRSSGSLDRQLEKMNDRWTRICRFVDDRHEKLKKAESIWKVLASEGPQLYKWLEKAQADLSDLSDVIQSVANSDTDKSFIMKLQTRSETIDQRIKSKQSFYTSLENRVRIEIDRFEDPCSMMVIELEKKLEDMQDHWNAIMRQKRMIDFSLHAIANPAESDRHSDLPLSRPMARVPESMTSSSKGDLRFNKLETLGDGDSVGNNTLDIYDEPLTNSSSMGHEDRGSSLQLNGSTSDPSKVFDTSFSSQDTRSLGTNNTSAKYRSNIGEIYQDEVSSATNLTSAQLTNSGADAMYADLQEDTTGLFPRALASEFPEYDETHQTGGHNHMHGGHNCRVEEWKHSLESFSSWLRQVESSLEVDNGPLEARSNDPTRSSLEPEASWSQLDMQQQITLLRDIDQRITTTCQDEFDCLFLQGQQIIEDLLPEIGENEYEVNLKDILADLEMRYGAIKRCLADRKHELADRGRWRRLCKKIRDSCDYVISQMEAILPENEIGVDLITLAQQQDQLLHLKEDTETNPTIQSSFKEARSFLHLFDTMQQQYGQQTSSSLPDQDEDFFIKIWMSFREFKDNIEDQLDRLQLHHSELSQLIQDRLDRLDEVHKEMHALQHGIQDLATRLQVTEILRSNWVPLDNLSIEQLSEQLEDLKLYRERLGEVESAHKLMNSIVDWLQEFGSPLSQSNMKRVDELNGIWDLIQLSVDDRQKAIEQAFDEQSGSEQKFLAQTVADVPGKWERRVATSKVPYFIDHNSNKTLWDHPKFTELLNSLDECKQYVYSVYRTALKLRFVQKRLGIEKLMLEHLKDMLVALDQQLAQQNSATASGSQAMNAGQQQQIVTFETQINIEQIISLLKAIYTKIQIEESPDLDVPVAIDLTLNWLLNLYDSTRTGHISALSLKVGLASLCCATREEKYIFMFELVANPVSRMVDARKLGTLFEICMRPPIYLGEDESFGGPDLIEISIRNCLSMSKFNPQHPNCINLHDYLNWLKTEPQFIIWLPVLHRILISENTMHAMKCRLCKTNPIVGLRYRCLICFKFNICQKCFLSGRHIFEHPNPEVHQMQEYCYRTGTSENVRDLAKIMRNKLIPRAGDGVKRTGKE